MWIKSQQTASKNQNFHRRQHASIRTSIPQTKVCMLENNPIAGIIEHCLKAIKIVFTDDKHI